MRKRTLVGVLLLAASALSCAPRADVPPAPPIPKAADSIVDGHLLSLTALDCVMAPIVYDAPLWATNRRQIASFGPDAKSCLFAANVIHVDAARLYRLDRDTLADIRHAIRRGAPEASRDAPDPLALFDRGVGAIMEGRRARTALVRESPHPSPEAVERIRAREMLVTLDDFGRRAGGAIGTEARAIAMLVGANDFLQVGRVRPLVRPYVAEPLFAMMFGPEFVSESPDEPTAPWGAYVAAAARAVTDHSEPTAIGGGPPTPDRRDLDVVTKGVSREMIALAERLPSGQLRDAVERTARELATFDVDEVVAGR